MTSTTTTLRAGHQPCQNGLVDDHPGGYRIESTRPDGVLVDLRPDEVRPGECRGPRYRTLISAAGGALLFGLRPLPADLEAEDPSRVVDNQGADVDLGQTALTQAGYDVGEQMVVSETAVGVKPMLGGDVV